MMSALGGILLLVVTGCLPLIGIPLAFWALYKLVKECKDYRRFVREMERLGIDVDDFCDDDEIHTGKEGGDGE